MLPGKVAVCVPYFGGRDHEHLDAIDQVRKLGITVVQLTNHPYIDQARCLLAERALGTGAEVVFFIDHDIVFEAKDVLLLAQTALENSAVVAALYITRRMGGAPVASLDPVPEEIWCFDRGGLYPASTLPGGFTAIPRDVLEGIPVKRALLGDGLTSVRLWFLNDPVWIEQEGQEVGVWLGEDTRFSQRARAAGFRLLLDTRPRLYHKGAHKFGVEDGAAPRDHGGSLRVIVNQQQRKIQLG